MENRVDMMENIQVAGKNPEAEKNESAAQNAITVQDILSRIDRIIAQGEQYAEVVRQIQEIPVNDSPTGGYDGAERAKSIGKLYESREETNQKMIALLTRMYDDMDAARANINVKDTVLDQLARRGFQGVEPGTAKEIMNFYRELL